MSKIRYSEPSRWYRRGKASSYIRRFEVRPGDRFVLCLRVSVRQNRTHLADQERVLRRAVERGGGVVIAVITHVGSGFDPYWIIRAAGAAMMWGATILAESTDRFRRSGDYHSSKHSDAQASQSELKDLVWWAGGAQLMTLLDPDAPAKEVRSHESKRGQYGNLGGRPGKPGYKKRKRMTLLPQALRLFEREWSVRAVAKKLRLPSSTVGDWRRDYVNCPVFADQ